MHKRVGFTVAAVSIIGILGLIFTAPPLAAQEGRWGGALNTGAAELRLVFHITETGDEYTATMDSPDQGVTGIPVSVVHIDGDSVRLEIPEIMGVYRGVITDSGDRIDGSWSQGPSSLPLDLEPIGEDTGPARPQIPMRPFPYEEEEVTIRNEEADVNLAGTFTRPAGEGPFPAVVLVTGSGPQDRNETLLGHPLFLVLSDYLTRQGIAVLRYDDRGVGGSTGDFASGTTADFATDARAAVEWLDDRGEVGDIGIVGHSEGGLIAPMVANATDDVEFVVLMAGPGLRGREILELQAALITSAMGAPAEVVEAQTERNSAAYEILLNEPNDSIARTKLRALFKAQMSEATAEQRAAAHISEDGEVAMIELQIDQMVSPWFRYFLKYNPAPALRDLDVPVLAINGSLDLQVPADENLQAIRAALEAGDTDHFRIVELPGLNHLFQTAETGAPSEYGTITETISPAAMEVIADWVLEISDQV